MSHSNMAPSRRACMVMFGLFCAVGIGISTAFATTTSTSCRTSKKVTKSLLSGAVDSFHRVNTLYDGTINCFSTAALSAVASNEVFTFKQAMEQDDRLDFIKVMQKEVSSHEDQEHWTMMERSKIPFGTKKS